VTRVEGTHRGNKANRFVRFPCWSQGCSNLLNGS
jgi:hypothetical protein